MNVVDSIQGLGGNFEDIGVQEAKVDEFHSGDLINSLEEKILWLEDELENEKKLNIELSDLLDLRVSRTMRTKFGSNDQTLKCPDQLGKETREGKDSDIKSLQQDLSLLELSNRHKAKRIELLEHFNKSKVDRIKRLENKIQTLQKELEDHTQRSNTLISERSKIIDQHVQVLNAQISDLKELNGVTARSFLPSIKSDSPPLAYFILFVSCFSFSLSGLNFLILPLVLIFLYILQ
jgi:DNA repair exonuclease SbcCD ATPase subunit